MRPKKTPEELKEGRAARWDKEIIVCQNHPERRCNRSRYRHDGHRHCAMCVATLANGTERNSQIRVKKTYSSSEQRRCTDRSRRLSLWIEERKI